MSAAPEPDFESVEEADQVYYGAGSGDGGGDGGQGGQDGARWGELQTQATDWRAGWTLGYQMDQVNEGESRWFVFRVNQSGAFEALSMTGQADTYPETASLDEIPHADDEQTARDAYQTWAEENPQDEGGEDGQDGENWTEWQKISQASDWTIWGREHQSEDRVEFLAASTMEDGTAVYLQPDGTIGESAHVYTSRQAVQGALDAYRTRVEEGDVEQGERPTGASPGRGQVRQDARNGSGGTSGPGGPIGTVVDAVGGPRNALIIGGVATAGVVYAERAGHINISEALE